MHFFQTIFLKRLFPDFFESEAHGNKINLGQSHQTTVGAPSCKTLLDTKWLSKALLMPSHKEWLSDYIMLTRYSLIPHTRFSQDYLIKIENVFSWTSTLMLRIHENVDIKDGWILRISAADLCSKTKIQPLAPLRRRCLAFTEIFPDYCVFSYHLNRGFHWNCNRT